MNFYHIIAAKHNYTNFIFFYTQINFIKFIAKYSYFKKNFAKYRVNMWLNLECYLQPISFTQPLNNNLASTIPICNSSNQFTTYRQINQRSFKKNTYLLKSFKKINLHNSTLNYTKYLELTTLNFNLNRSIWLRALEKTQSDLTLSVVLLFLKNLNWNHLFNFTKKFFFIFKFQSSVLQTFNQSLVFDFRKKLIHQKNLLNINFRFL